MRGVYQTTDVARVSRHRQARLAAKKKNARRPSPGVFYWGRVGAEWNVERPPALAERVRGQGGIRGRAGSSPKRVLTSSAGRYRRGFRQSFVVAAFSVRRDERGGR